MIKEKLIVVRNELLLHENFPDVDIFSVNWRKMYLDVFELGFHIHGYSEVPEGEEANEFCALASLPILYYKKESNRDLVDIAADIIKSHLLKGTPSGKALPKLMVDMREDFFNGDMPDAVYSEMDWKGLDKDLFKLGVVMHSVGEERVPSGDDWVNPTNLPFISYKRISDPILMSNAVDVVSRYVGKAEIMTVKDYGVTLDVSSAWGYPGQKAFGIEEEKVKWEGILTATFTTPDEKGRDEMTGDIWNIDIVLTVDNDVYVHANSKVYSLSDYKSECSDRVYEMIRKWGEYYVV